MYHIYLLQEGITQMAGSKFDKLLADLFPPMKQPTLPSEVIDAVKHCTNTEQQKKIQEWLRHTADKNAVDASGHTLLHHATLAGQVKMVEFLVKQRLNPNAEDDKGYTPLIWAIEKLYQAEANKRQPILNCMSYLLEHGARPVSSGIFPQSGMNIAALHGDLDIIKLLERHNTPLNENIMLTPLWWAKSAKNQTEGHRAVIAYLEEHGCTLEPAASGPR
jgi:ankyrin repeat protein